MKFVLGLLTLSVFCWSRGNGYNVLMMLPFGSKSHKNIFDAIGQELVTRGHEVTMYSLVNGSKPLKGITHIYPDGIEKKAGGTGNFSFFSGSMDNLSTLKRVADILFMIRDLTYEQPQLRSLWEDPSAPKYDVMVIDAIFNEFVLPVAHRLQIPAVYISPTVLFNGISYNLNIPYPYSYLSSGLSKYHYRMNFWQRIRNAFENVAFLLLRHWYLFPAHDRYIRTIFPECPPLIELESNVSFVMTHTHPALFPSTPSMPYTAEIACVHCVPGKKLPEDLLNYFENSGEAGVIYFSLGSATKGAQMPLEMRDKVVQAFAQLPQRILWKYEEAIEGLPKNIKLTDWAPQQDVLAHPKLSLFITHGGGLSAFEAAYHGSPILGFPLSADQLANMAHCENAGYGETLDWKTFTAEDLVNTIKTILSDKRYKEKALFLSKLLKDQPQSPKTKAAYWIEYVIRHRGAPHLKSSADQLNFFQYFLFDVIGVIALTLIVVVAVIYFLIRAICRFICSRTCKVAKNEAQGKKQNKNKKHKVN